METFLQVLNNVVQGKTNLHCVNYYIALPWVPEVIFFQARRWARIATRRTKYGNLWSNKPATSLPCDVWDMNWICCTIGWQQSQLLAEVPVHWKSGLEKLKEWSCEENNITRSLECSWLCLKIANFPMSNISKLFWKKFTWNLFKKKHVLCPFWLVAVSCWFSIYYSAIGQFQFTQERVWLPKKPILCVISLLIYLI